VKPYPLQTCIVSDEPLSDSRQPISINYQGQEVRVCCRECKRDFQNDPQKFLKKILGAE
jgi:YHS domain-containing protein